MHVLCAREKIWLHVDAAYGGVAAMLTSHRHVLEGAERADSFVVNPHKWLFTPFDLTAFYYQRMDVLRAAFALTPEYLQTRESGAVKNLMDTGVQLGRRFRSLKLWAVLRCFGADGLRAIQREHIRLAELFAGLVAADERWELVAPQCFSRVCFRWVGSDEENERLLERVNASGEIFINHTKLDGRYVLRLAIGNARTTEVDVRRAWDVLNKEAER